MRKTKQKETIQRGSSALALKAGFWYVFSSFVVKAIGFITTPIFSRLMSKADYGEFSNFASWLATLGIITSAELYNTVSRAYYDHKDNFSGYTSTVALLGCFFTIALYIVFMLCRSFIFKVVTIPPQYVHLMFIILLSQCCKQVFMTRERTLYRYKKVAAISFINLLIPTLTAVGLVYLLPEADRLASRLYGFYVPSTIVGLLCGAAILYSGRSFKVSYCKYALALSVPMLAHYLTAYLLTSTNMIVTKNVLGAEAAAVVSIANSTIHILTVFFQAVSGAFTTWMMDNLEQNNRKKVAKDSLAYVAILAVVAGGVILLAPEFVKILGGKQYAEAVNLLPGFVTAIFIQSTTTLFTIILTYDKNITKTAIWTGVIAVAAIALKVFILPVTGTLGLPYINIAAFFALFVINYLILRKAGYADAVSMKGILGIVLAVVLVMFAGLALYPYTIARYAVIAAIGVVALIVAIKRKDDVRKLLKMLRKKKK